MKKIIALLITLLMLLTSVAYGADLSFLKMPYKNYSSEGTLKITFDESGSFEELLNELGAEEEGGEIIDLIPFIKSLLSFDGNGKTQINMSNDYKKMEAAFTFDTTHYISVNPNLDADVRTKSGVWIKMDMSDRENPVYNMILSTPLMKKYMVFDLFDLIGEEKGAFLAVMDTFMNEEFINAQSDFAIKTITENAQVKSSNNKYIITLDNDAFIKVVKAFIEYAAENFDSENILPEESELEEIKSFVESLDLSDLQILGEKGIVITYGIKNRKLSSVDITADICINLAELYSKISGLEWEYASEGILEFDVKISEKITALHTVDVKFPELTEENSVDFGELYNNEYETEEEYPHYGVYVECDYLPVVDGEVYVPLRQTIEEAYDDTAAISYENGSITLASENFKDFSSLSFAIGSDKVYSEIGEYTIKPPVMQNGVSYVPVSFFTNVFKWEFNGATQDVLNNTYYYDFYTHIYEDDSEDYEFSYPYYYVSGYSDINPVIDNEIYVPLRATLESGYADSVSIAFENGAIKLESEFFPGFKTLTFAISSDKAYSENSEYNIGNVFIDNGTTYVNKKLFEEIFGWELTGLSYYMDNNYWYYEFVTSQ